MYPQWVMLAASVGDNVIAMTTMTTMTRSRPFTEGRDSLASAELSVRSLGPHPPRGIVERQRLLRRLDAAARVPLTLVSAPAGTGKSVLVSSWAATADPRDHVVWITLDDVRAQSAAIAALLEGRHRPIEPLTLILDNAELAGTELSHDIEVLMGRPDSWIRLVLIAREDPELALDRYRRAGSIAELRAADLAFTEEETFRLVQACGLHLTPRSVGAVWGRTQGWAAGLGFAASYLSCCADPDQAVRELPPSPPHGSVSEAAASATTARLARQFDIALDVDALAAATDLIEPLTARESEVLGCLAALLSTEEIASVMYVSVNTVRTHVRSILRKLAVSKRNDAVRRARALRLIGC